MKILTALLFGLFIGVLATTGSIRSFAQDEPQLAKLENFGNFLSSEGTWRADILNDKTEAAFESVTRLECYRHGGRDLVGTDAYCMEATAQIIARDLPDIGVTYLPVTVWDEDKVIASTSSTAPYPICNWTQIAINLRDHSIMATETRKLGKGHEGFNNLCLEMPLAVTYHLVDKPAEHVRRASRRSQ